MLCKRAFGRELSHTHTEPHIRRYKLSINWGGTLTLSVVGKIAGESAFSHYLGYTLMQQQHENLPQRDIAMHLSDRSDIRRMPQAKEMK